jgi:hypothetical protein
VPNILWRKFPLPNIPWQKFPVLRAVQHPYAATALKCIAAAALIL